MTADADARTTLDTVLEAGYRLVVDERFGSPELDRDLWFPCYLPHWSSRATAAARYRLNAGRLELLIEADQEPWCPEFDGHVRVSSLQTGEFAGPLGTGIGQHRFNPDATVRKEQEPERLYTPQYGVFVLRCMAPRDPACLAALWMIGYEDEPEESGVIDIFEIFGEEADVGHAGVRMNIKAFDDPHLVDDEATVALAIDVEEFHDYAIRWTAESVAFFVDGEPVRRIDQAPQYPMQFMLGLYDLRHDPANGTYPKRFVVDSFLAYEPTENSSALQP